MIDSVPGTERKELEDRLISYFSGEQERWSVPPARPGEPWRTFRQPSDRTWAVPAQRSTSACAAFTILNALLYVTRGTLPTEADYTEGQMGMLRLWILKMLLQWEHSGAGPVRGWRVIAAQQAAAGAAQQAAAGT